MGLRLYRQGRVQFQPLAGITLQDQFSRTVLAGGSASYHLSDWLGIGVWGGYGVASLDTYLTTEVQIKGQPHERNVLSLPDPSVFPQQVGRIKWVGVAQALFIPLRGKMGLFEKVFIDTDFYLGAGVAFVGVEERGEATAAQFAACGTDFVSLSTCVRSQILAGRTPRSTIAPTFSAGLTLYLSGAVSLTLEWRALPFAWNTSGTDEAGALGAFPDGAIDARDRLSHFNHMVSVGLGLSLPSSVKIWMPDS